MQSYAVLRILAYGCASVNFFLNFQWIVMAIFQRAPRFFAAHPLCRPHPNLNKAEVYTGGSATAMHLCAFANTAGIEFPSLHETTHTAELNYRPASELSPLALLS